MWNVFHHNVTLNKLQVMSLLLRCTRSNNIKGGSKCSHKHYIMGLHCVCMAGRQSDTQQMNFTATLRQAQTHVRHEKMKTHDGMLELFSVDLLDHNHVDYHVKYPVFAFMAIRPSIHFLYRDVSELEPIPIYFGRETRYTCLVARRSQDTCSVEQGSVICGSFIHSSLWLWKIIQKYFI